MPKNQKNTSEAIVKKFINEAANKTNDELKRHLDELKKLKEEIVNTSR